MRYLLALLIGITVHAEERKITPEQFKKFAEDALANYEKAVATLEGDRACRVDEIGAGVTKSAQACTKTYSNFYSKKSLDIRISFGYQDSRPTNVVTDRVFFEAFKQRLKDPCKPGVFACELTNTPVGSDKWVKKNVIGPDGQPHDVVITLEPSSASTNDDDNRGSLAADQKKQTDLAKQNFLDGITKPADAVFYFGHARAGGGPDFDPPQLDGGKHPDYKNYYQKNQPGLNALNTALNSAGNGKPKLLGLFACKSDSVLAKDPKLASALSGAPDMGLITNDDVITRPQNFRNMYAAVDNLLGQRCQKTFDKNLVGNPEPGDGKSFEKNFFKN